MNVLLRFSSNARSVVQVGGTTPVLVGLLAALSGTRSTTQTCHQNILADVFYRIGRLFVRWRDVESIVAAALGPVTGSAARIRVTPAPTGSNAASAANCTRI